MGLIYSGAMGNGAGRRRKDVGERTLVGDYDRHVFQYVMTEYVEDGEVYTTSC